MKFQEMQVFDENSFEQDSTEKYQTPPRLGTPNTAHIRWRSILEKMYSFSANKVAMMRALSGRYSRTNKQGAVLLV